MVGWRRCARLVVALAALLGALAGCGLPGQAQPDALASDQTLKIVLPLDGGGENPLANLDPVEGLYPPYLQASSLLFDGLLTLDRSGHVEPWGAASWTISPDGTRYTFTLRPNQRFSDGAPVKASDYAWSIDRIANPCLGLFNYDSSVFTDYSFLALVKDAPAFHDEACARGQPTGAITSLIGDALLPNDSAGTLTFILVRPAGYFLAALATSWGDVVERSVITGLDLGRDGAWTKRLDAGKTGQGGSGMFYLADAEIGAAPTGSKLILKPNPHWWGIAAGKRPHFSEVDILAGNIDTFLGDTSIGYGDVLNPGRLASALSQIKRAPYYRETPSFSMAVLHFNWKKAPFDDLNARKAFCLAIDRAALDQQVMKGNDIPGWHITPRGMDGYNAQLRGLDGAPVTGDASLAKQYWQRYLAAHNNHAPQIIIPATSLFLHSGNGGRPLAQMWKQVLGVDSRVFTPDVQDPTPSEQLNDYVASVDFADPEDVLSWLASPNVYGINVPAAQPLLRQADTLSEMSQRIPLYQQAEQLLIDDVAVCPLFQVVDAYALRPWVKGDFAQNGLGVIPNDAWVSGYIAKH